LCGGHIRYVAWLLSRAPREEAMKCGDRGRGRVTSLVICGMDEDVHLYGWSKLYSKSVAKPSKSDELSQTLCTVSVVKTTRIAVESLVRWPRRR
jgi:hypothetical protein